MRNNAKKYFFQFFQSIFFLPHSNHSFILFSLFIKKKKKKSGVSVSFEPGTSNGVGLCLRRVPIALTGNSSNIHCIYHKVDPCDAVDQSERSIAASANAFISNRYPVNIAFVFRGS